MGIGRLWIRRRAVEEEEKVLKETMETERKPVFQICKNMKIIFVSVFAKNSDFPLKLPEFVCFSKRMCHSLS